MTPNTDILTPEATYHIFNRINGEGELFRTEENYRYFLELFRRYISPVAEIFYYCLMPNHFHFLLRIRSLEELKPCQGSKPLTGFGQEEVSRFLSRQFSHLLNSYGRPSTNNMEEGVVSLCGISRGSRYRTKNIYES